MTQNRLFPQTLTALGAILIALILTMAMLTLVHAQASPSISITKEPDQTIVTGSNATFTITVINTGDVTLTNVTVSDALVSPCNREIGNLNPGGSTNYQCTTLEPVTADFINSATVNATGELSATHVSDTDTASVDVIAPGIAIEKTPDDQTVVAGSTATFTITVLNTSDVTLANVTVSDPQAPNCAQALGSLSSGESRTHTCILADVQADFINSATVTGTPPVGPDVSDTDTANVNVINPAIEIAKTPDFQTVISGSPVTFTIALTNTGDVLLTNVTVVDALVDNCNQTLVSLAAEESTSYTCTLSSALADFTNSATVTGTPPLGEDVSDTDTAMVNVINPGIEIAKTPDEQTVTSGNAATFDIVVTNNGDAPLTGVTVSDARSPDCNRTFATLAAGGHQSYSCQATGVTDGFINSATVAGTTSNGYSVTSADAASVKLDETQTCPTDMLAYWKLDETGGDTYDDFYFGHDGECTDQCPAPATGHVNGGQAFDGNDTGIDVPAVPGNDSFNWGAEDSFSVEFWIKADSAHSCSLSNEIVVGRDDRPSSQLHWWVGVGCGSWANGAAAFVLQDRDGGDDTQFAVGTTDLTDGSWYHIVAVRDGTAHQNHLYVNGIAEASVGSATYSSGFDAPTAAINIGWLDSSHGYHFNGTADEITIYNRALSPGEVRQHHNEGLAGRWYCQAGTYAPLIVSTPVTEATIGQLYTYDVEAAGNPVPTYTLEIFPDSMTIDPLSGLISWTPTLAQQGDNNVEVKASSSEGSHTQSFTIAAAEGTICPTNMIAYWKLDETGGTSYYDFYDGLDGTCGDQCPTPATGHINGGQAFDGSSNEIDVPRDEAFDWSQTDSFSIEFWMQTDSASTCSGNQVVVGRDDSSTPLHWWVGCQNGGDSGEAAFFLIDTAGTLYSAIGTTDLTDGAWHHVVATRDAGADQIHIYVDGAVQDSTSATYGAGFGSSTAALNIGHLLGGHHFDGIVDEVALYNRTLSEAEILLHYNDRAAGPGYCINPDIAVNKTADPAIVYLGNSVTYIYTVTNPGDAPLSNVLVSDDKCSSVSFDQGDDDGDDRLDPSETWIYTCPMSPSADITNTVTVTGTHSMNGQVKDADTISVDVIAPNIAVDKTADATLIYAGETVTYTYAVTNPGDDPLSGVSVSDDKCSPVTFVEGDENSNYKLDPSETWRYSCSTTLNADVTNTATVTGTDSAGGTVNATNTAFVDVRDSTITVIKNASDDNIAFDFTLTYSGHNEPFQLKNGEGEQFSDLAPGSYTIAETVASTWKLFSITCDNGISVTHPDVPAVTINLLSGENVSCTFTNEKSLKIYLPAIVK